ncbi:hypothetical protein SAMN05216551_1012 [Chitinasiproducens palmae]|uniref:Right handed beta helix domain-containing protein n=2 Tax=Chitinasiproducens palmae TaxID=1770053 RepID=A0A1H2PIA8_9BURK|nr:hypothetical protein SAMN05216551_1012 [Chitinasiproducens palmae]
MQKRRQALKTFVGGMLSGVLIRDAHAAPNVLPAPTTGTPTRSSVPPLTQPVQPGDEVRVYRSGVEHATTVGRLVDKAAGDRLETLEALMGFKGNAEIVTVTDPLRGGDFVIDSATSGPVDGVLTLRDGQGRRRRRVFSGPLLAKWWGVSGDGRACGDALAHAYEAVMRTGGALCLPPGEVNCGTTRYALKADAQTKPFVITSEGYTLLSYDNVDPPSRPSGRDWVTEPVLFSYTGQSVAQPAPPCIFDGQKVGMSYQRQRNKGGTDLATLGQTHPTPHSVGTQAIRFEHVVRPEVRCMRIADVYGNGILAKGCLDPIFADNQLINVSGNNVVSRTGSMSRDSDGGGIFVSGGYGGTIENNIVWNERRYLVDFKSPDNGQAMKDTLCGYIGVWAEFAMNIDEIKPVAPFDGLIEASSKVNSEKRRDNRNRKTVIRGNTVYGYVIGIKTEADVVATISDNCVLNCYLPIFASGTTGVIEHNYVDMLQCGSIRCPQNGLETVRAHIPGHTFGQDGPSSTGLTIRDNTIHTANAYPAFGLSRDAVTIADNTVWFSGTRAGPIVATGGASRLDKSPTISGNRFFYGKDVASVTETMTTYTTALAYTSNIHISFSTARIKFNFGSFKTPSEGAHIARNSFYGDFDVTTEIGNSVVEKNTFVRSEGCPGGRCLHVSSLAKRSVVSDNAFHLQSAIAEIPLWVEGEQCRVEGNVFQLSGTAKPTVPALSKSEQAQRLQSWHANTITGNAQGLALVFGYNLQAPSFTANVSDGPAHCVVCPSGAPYGPVQYDCTNGFEGGFSASPMPEPNTSGRLAASVKPVRGMRLPPYLYPKAGGAEGEVYIDAQSGWKKYGVISA